MRLALRVPCGILAGVLLLLIAAWDSGFHGKICEYDQGAHQNNCTTYNLAFFVIIKSGEIINYYGPLITALATIAIACFTYTLYKSTSGLRDSTNKLWKAGELHSERELRAYLGVTGGAIGSPDWGNTFEAEIHLINAGPTPARKITGSIAAELQIRNGAPVIFKDPPRDPGEWVMVPGSEYILRRAIAIGGQTGTSSISTGERIIFVWGRVDYVDVFGKDQHLTFRYRSAHPTRAHTGTVMVTTGWNMDPEGEGNTAT
jgi:hypothetical protein